MMDNSGYMTPCNCDKPKIIVSEYCEDFNVISSTSTITVFESSGIEEYGIVAVYNNVNSRGPVTVTPGILGSSIIPSNFTIGRGNSIVFSLLTFQNIKISGTAGSFGNVYITVYKREYI